jgi:hypothetical protein
MAAGRRLSGWRKHYAVHYPLAPPGFAHVFIPFWDKSVANEQNWPKLSDSKKE